MNITMGTLYSSFCFLAAIAGVLVVVVNNLRKRLDNINSEIKAEVEKAKAEIEEVRGKANEDLWRTGTHQVDYIKNQAMILAEHDASFVDRVVESINRKQLK